MQWDPESRVGRPVASVGARVGALVCGADRAPGAAGLGNDVCSRRCVVMSLEASAPAFSIWTVGGSGGLSCKVSGPQKRPKRRINAFPGKRCVECASCSSARAASPWSGNATLSTTSRAALAAVAALSKFAAPSRRTRWFASSDPVDRSVRKLTTICGRARRVTSAKAGSS
jgi:hypothetical protein